MKVMICETPDAAYDVVAGLVVAQVAKKANSVLGLATGNTMLPVYERLSDRAGRAEVSFAMVTTFNLDEYVGLPADHPASFHTYMRQAFFDRTDIDPAKTHLPRGDCPDVASECARYETLIRSSGGIDLQLLGIGRNGHIGFNEPTSSLGSRTRIKTLTETTREANAGQFGSREAVPRFALTMGIATILETRHCVLLATGHNKASAVASMIEGPVSAICPASALQLHPTVTVVLDRSAASMLRLQDY